MNNYTNINIVGQSSSIVFKTNKNDVSGHWTVKSDTIQQLYDGMAIKVLLVKAPNKVENFLSILDAKGNKIGGENLVYNSEGEKITNKHFSRNAVLDLTYLTLDGKTGWFANATIVPHMTIEPSSIIINADVTSQGHIRIITDDPNPNYTPQGCITIQVEEPEEGEEGNVVTDASALPFVINEDEREEMVFTKASKKKLSALFKGKGVKMVHEGITISATAEPHTHNMSIQFVNN